MITLNHTVNVEVDFETLSDAENFHDAIRDFIREYQFHSELELSDHTETCIQDRPHQ